ncbi:DUF397 domain-containing protein [Pseudonocardia zijingensis]|jgi:hypothetical protein|uniref:DUF397 domain-containing protein n=1 Tax=Pseudonocardia zijingensis TaxID=153376 RepID=A0ABN1Q5S3_9PSEU
MPTLDPAGTWRKSSFSGGNGGADGCVEVAALPGGVVAVRDTKDRTRPAHHHPAAAWTAFLAGVRAGEFEE